MELVFYTTIAWLVITYLIISIKEKEVIRSIIIYFIYTILSVSIFTIINLNLQWIDVTEDKTKFLSLLVNRNIIMPFLILISINFFYRLTIYEKRVIPIILLIFIIAILEIINLQFQLYSYVKWNFGLMLLVNTLLILIILITSKYINITQIRSVHK